MSKDEEQSLQMERLNHAPFLWKVSGFQAVYKKAITGEQKVIFSEPFYLYRCGYKLRIKIMPNGGSEFPKLNKKYEGKYLSVYLVVVPGDYDWLLPWPIAEEVSVTLIDQDPRQDIKTNISKVVDFKSSDLQWFRPQGESTIGLGYGGFVEQNILHTRSYLHNDTMFIMVSKNNAQ